MTLELASREPVDARGTKSVAHRSGRSSTTSHVGSSEPCRLGDGERLPGRLPTFEVPIMEAGDNRLWYEDVCGSTG